MTISVIVQSYNFEKFLAEAIRSALALRNPCADEIIVVDDASTDRSVCISRSFDDPRIRVIAHDKNMGAAATLNEAIALCEGDYIARLDGDDRYRPDFLTHAMEAFRRNPDAVAVYGCIAMIDGSGRITSTERSTSLPADVHCGDRFMDLLEDNFLSAPTLVARRDAWFSALPVPSDMPFCDWYCALRIAECGPIAFTNEIHADYRVHEQGMHVIMMQDGWGEGVYRRVLDTIMGESSRAGEKATRRASVYGAWYRRIGDSYFGGGRFGDARRCYGKAIRFKPFSASTPTIARRWAATWITPAQYERLKEWFRRPISSTTRPSGNGRTHGD